MWICECAAHCREIDTQCPHCHRDRGVNGYFPDTFYVEPPRKLKDIYSSSEAMFQAYTMEIRDGAAHRAALSEMLANNRRRR
jgi:hypothetical protein